MHLVGVFLDISESLCRSSLGRACLVKAMGFVLVILKMLHISLNRFL